MTKTCRECGEDKPLDQFYSKGTNPRDCKPCYMAKVHLRRTGYGWTPRQMRLLWEMQGRRCAVCATKVQSPSCHRNVKPEGEGEKSHVDHDHETKRVRGILCVKCNRAIGQMDESHMLAQYTHEYLVASYS